MRVLVAYHMFPHYRKAIVRALEKSEKNSYVFLGHQAAQEGIKPIEPHEFKQFIPAAYKIYRGLYWQPGLIRESLFGQFDAYIYLSNPNFVSTWLGAAIARIRGKKVLFWGHGWLKPEAKLKSIIRKAFYNLANHMMVYGERAKLIGESQGYPSKKITAIYNSLDFDLMEDVFHKIEAGELSNPYPQIFKKDASFVISCVARITKKCRFDVLIRALSILKDDGLIFNSILIGDGPELPSLQRLAADLGVDVKFFGPSYNEETLGPLLYFSDVVVSPGKVGLTAMHSMSYGTPVISHSDFDEQMPEVEAIAPGVSGAFFQRDDERDLALVLKSWYSRASSRQQTRALCRSVIQEKWNAQNQARLIENCLNSVSDKD